MGKRKAGVNDTRALEEIAGVLKAIIARDWIRRLDTTGLENAVSEIERSVRRRSPDSATDGAKP